MYKSENRGCEKMSAGQRIKNLRFKNNVSQKELSKDLGYKTYTTVSKWESNASLPPGKELTKLAEYFNVTTDYLLGLDDMPTPTQAPQLPDTVELDFVRSEIPGFLHNDLIKDKIHVPGYIIDEAPDHYFVVNIQTDSMNRIIPSGHNVVVLNFEKSDCSQIHTGDVIIVRIDNEYKMQYYRKTDTKVYLEPYSYLDGYSTTEFTVDEFKKIQIIGKVIYSFRRF